MASVHSEGMWVRSEYASELAVLSAWIAVLLPWNVAYQPNAPPEDQASVYFFRFALFEIQFRRPWVVEVNGEVTEFVEPLDITHGGTQLFGNVYARLPTSAATFYDGTMGQASLLWTLAALAFAVAFALSLGLYVREDAVAAKLPVSEVRLMGGLLAVGAVGTVGASALYLTARDSTGIPIPVGALVVAVLAVVLLRTEEVDPDG